MMDEVEKVKSCRGERGLLLLLFAEKKFKGGI